MVARVRTLPSVSPGSLKLLALLSQPSAINEEIVEAVRTDTVLTAKLLRACNSPALGIQVSVNSVDQAVLLLGYNEIQRMVATLALRGTLTAHLPGYETLADSIWRHSLLAATAAERIVNQGADICEPSTAFTIGLLHDIGKLILGQFLTTETRTTTQQLVAEGCSTDEAERRVFGTDHAEVVPACFTCGACRQG